MNNRNNNPRGRGRQDRTNQGRGRRDNRNVQRRRPRGYPQDIVEDPWEPEFIPGLSRRQIREADIQYAKEVLDHVPDRDWGTVEDRLKVFDDFYDIWGGGYYDQAWYAANIVFMDEPTFEKIQRNGESYGQYRFCAYVRMYNYMRMTEYDRRRCIMFGTSLAPVFPEVVDLRMFLEPRADHQFAEVNEHLARLYLDQRTVISQNVTERLRQSLRGANRGTMDWVAANIRHMDSRNIWTQVPAYWPVARRTQNWLNMHVSWQVEFMSIGFISFGREAVRFDPDHPENLDCLRDAPNFNRTLVMTEQLANDFLNRTSTFRFNSQQIYHLFFIWRRAHPEYRPLLKMRMYVRGQSTRNRMLNWLTLHDGWKHILRTQVWHLDRE